MKANWGVIKLLLIVVVAGLLYSFSLERNKSRTLSGIAIEFVDENSPFITLKTVNKLLIQNVDSVTSIPKETLVLKEMESRLLENPMVRDAEVFVTVDGKLGAKIEQKNPIARVAASGNYYLDEDGNKMPLSMVYSARVPLLTGTSETDFVELTPLLLKIRQDEFMNQSVVGIHRFRNGSLELSMRTMDFKVKFGTLADIEKKFQNFKSFYQKARKDKMLKEYSSVNLQFGNQVVAIKK